MTDTRSPAEILRAAKSRITDKHHWTRYKAARNRYSHGVPPTDNRAVRWCVAGAFICEADGVPEAVGQSAWDFLLRVIARGDSPQWVNDVRGHEAVLQMLDRAIALAESDHA